MRSVSLVGIFGAAIGLAQLPAQQGPAPQKKAAPGSSLEERTGTTRVTWRTRTLVGNDRLMQWKTGPGATAFPQLTFLEAVTATDGLGLDAIEGFNQQKVSPEIRKNLDDHLTPDEIAAVKNALKAANVQMRGYRVESLAPDRNVFEFAKAVGTGLIIGSPSLASLAELDKLAGEFDIKVAIENRNAKNAMTALEGRSQRLGICADTGGWMQEGMKPLDGLALTKDRLLAVRLHSVAGMTPFFNGDESPGAAATVSHAGECGLGRRGRPHVEDCRCV